MNLERNNWNTPFLFCLWTVITVMLWLLATEQVVQTFAAKHLGFVNILVAVTHIQIILLQTLKEISGYFAWLNSGCDGVSFTTWLKNTYYPMYCVKFTNFHLPSSISLLQVNWYQIDYICAILANIDETI